MNRWYIVLLYFLTVFTMLLFTGLVILMVRLIWKQIKKKSPVFSGKSILFACLALLTALVNPLSILMVYESVTVVIMKNRVLNWLFHLWSLFLFLLFIVLVGLLFVAIWQATKERSLPFLKIIVLLLCSALVIALINPLGNLLIFESITQAAVKEMWKSLKTNDVLGKPSQVLLELYGKPRRIGRGYKNDATWYYYPGPWYTAKWTTILINVHDDKVVEYFQND